jgi:uncharacterized protein
MSFSLSNASVDAFTTTLTSLSNVLEKAAAHAAAKKIDPAVLLGTRLYPDMFALTRQVQIATDQAKNGTSRLAGVEPPRFEDTETTIEQLRERLARTIAHLKSLDRKAIDAASDKEILFPVGPQNKFKMKGGEYLTGFVIPNFYFHCTAAYAILRHCGVEIGKRDFVGQIPMVPA